MKCAKSVFVVLGFALLSPAPFPHLIPAAHAQNQTWITQFGTIGGEHASDLAPDGAGGVMVAGGTTGSLGGPHAGGFSDAYLARYDSAGNQLWIRQFGTSERDDADALAPDGAGGVFVSGSTSGSLGGPNAGGFDVFLARYDSAGSQLWIRQFGTSEWDNFAVLAPDGAGGVMVAGSTGGNLGGPNAGPGSTDAFLARYDSAGNRLWIRQFGTSEFDSARALAPDGAGGVMVAGRTSGSLGGPNAGQGDVFLARYDSAGNQLWIRQFGTSVQDSALALAPDGAGGVMVAGNTLGSLGGPNAGEWDGFLARYNSAGDRLWIRQFGTSESEGASALAPDGAGGVMVAGETSGSLGGPNAGSSDAFLARYDSAGSQLWIKQFGTSSSDSARALAPDGAGGVMVAGHTLGSLGGPNPRPRFSDVFLARYSTGVCYADCDQSGVLDIFDFLCFQNSFVLGEPYACDCDPDPACDIFDFLCFQNAFVGGCL